MWGSQRYVPGAVELSAAFTAMLVGLTLLCAWAWFAETRSDAILDSRGVTVEGTIVDAPRGLRGGPEAVVDYRVDGEQRRRTLHRRTGERVGGSILVRADPLDDRNDRREDEPTSLGWMLFFGTMSLAATIAMAVQTRRELRRREEERRRWDAAPRRRRARARRTASPPGPPVRAAAGGPAIARRLRPAVILSAAFAPAVVGGVAAYEPLRTADPAPLSAVPSLAFAALILLAGATSRLRIDADGVLTSRLFGVRRRVRLTDLIEVGGRAAAPVPPRFPAPTLGATLLLHDARGGRVGLTRRLWCDDEAVLARIAEHVSAGRVPIAEPAATALDVPVTGEVPPDLRLAPWVASPLVMLFLALGVLFVF